MNSIKDWPQEHQANPHLYVSAPAETWGMYFAPHHGQAFEPSFGTVAGARDFRERNRLDLGISPWFGDENNYLISFGGMLRVYRLTPGPPEMGRGRYARAEIQDDQVNWGYSDDPSFTPGPYTIYDL